MGAKKRLMPLALTLTFAAVGVSAAGLPTPTVVTGAGSTFVTPILTRWSADYMADFHASGGTKIVYQSIGSGAGIEAIKAHIPSPRPPSFW